MRGDDSYITEQRHEVFKAEIADYTEDLEEIREENIDYSHFEKQIEILKLKGSYK